ncbi:MAG: CDP-alcohol phosphatidyltransferase family protein [Christensenellales bacterium]
MRKPEQQIVNVPNALTMLRMLLIPVYWVLMMGRGDETSALLVFAAASFTDLLDGMIARRFNLITDFGKLFDPLADKLMVLSVLLSLVIRQIVPLAVLVIMVLKEGIMILGGALMLRRKVVVFSKPIGKVSQAVIVLGLALCFFRESFRAGLPLHLIVLWTGVAMTLGALMYYTRACLRALKDGGGAAPKAQED